MSKQNPSPPQEDLLAGAIEDASKAFAELCHNAWEVAFILDIGFKNLEVLRQLNDNAMQAAIVIVRKEEKEKHKKRIIKT